jgi:hypothetical protein
MTNDAQFTTESARQAAAADELGEWVRRFLVSPGSDNPGLAEILSDPPRSWLGPVEIPLDQLHRLAGPPGHPVMEAVDDDAWREDVRQLAAKIREGHEAAPVVATYRGDRVVLEDGNHRVEALREAGEARAWAVIAFDDDAARDGFIERTEAPMS